MKYIGKELDVFEIATNWKGYFGNMFRDYIGGHVAEVGAGSGGTTQFLINAKVSKWVCLEPDKSLSEGILGKLRDLGVEGNVVVLNSKLDCLPDEERYDTIVYIDVIEHIEDDIGELLIAKNRLKVGGSLIILAPAYNYLFTEFDKAIGHYRRYNMRMLKSIVPKEMKLEFVRYLDSVGFFASLANKLLLKSSNPTIKQVKFWDNVLIRISIVMDRVLCYRFGKTIIGVWRK
ncbi:MAG: hypothetical protein A2X12_07530 [Bacteroidetes bacterium GWE2_29_8]|nr:MAG: hypothetical protein A2X12_07530 [Bacteroidetes bacterium GWE2_29_8]OFY22068.1 MAG: hypothetical protein A2X02_04475 [Bacteroidetes bacterium GWF2_29_10]